ARARDLGVPVIYYISPQVWAWRPGRIRQIRRLVRKMIVIFDFEEDLYRKNGVDAVFVGHPLLDHLPRDRDRRLRSELRVGDAPLVGLLPGSRPSQFRRLMPRMAETARIVRAELPHVRFIVGVAPKIDPKPAMRPGLDVVWNRTPEVMAASDLLVTASGTATIEAAILGTPMIVTYVLHPLMVLAVKPFLRVKNYAMVNIVAGREVMPELYQARARPELLARETLSILREGRLPQMREELAAVRKKLGEPGASTRAAREVLAVIDRR
ncbi:MAG: lipid-A-disaccharide synthase, partial [Planctomycetes bacterium]|nr:lipid-A-disaccharide synthase [Planctomycetota bacterium]